MALCGGIYPLVQNRPRQVILVERELSSLGNLIQKRRNTVKVHTTRRARDLLLPLVSRLALHCFSLSPLLFFVPPPYLALPLFSSYHYPYHHPAHDFIALHQHHHCALIFHHPHHAKTS